MLEVYEIIKVVSPHLGYVFAILYLSKKAKELLISEFKKVIESNDKGVDKQIKAVVKQQKDMRESFDQVVTIAEMHVEELKYVHEKVDEHEEKITSIFKTVDEHEEKIIQLQK